jgi:hypothetical protein
MKTTLVGGVVALLLGLAADAKGQAKLGPGDKPCDTCNSTGRLPFELPKKVVEQEKGCVYCSEVAGSDALNHGLDYKPCPKCEAPSIRDAVAKKYAEETKLRVDWLKGRREIDQYLDDPKGLKLMHVATKHFELAWAVPKIKIGRQEFDQHQALHIYANRLEEEYAEYLTTFTLSEVDDQHDVRYNVMCFEQMKHCSKAQPKYCGGGGTGAMDGLLLVGDHPYFVCWWNKTRNREDADFHEYLVHNAIHLFLDPTVKFFWLARKNGWIDEGLAHYFTDRRFSRCRSHCFQEQDEAGRWTPPPWRPEIRKRVIANKIPVFAEVVVKHGETLTAEEHLFVWSWIQYLNDAFDRRTFVKLIAGLKDQTPLRNLLKDLYGVTEFQFLENWKKYVVETYPPR